MAETARDTRWRSRVGKTVRPGVATRMAYVGTIVAILAVITRPPIAAAQPPGKPSLLKGHTHSVSSAGFTPNGKIVVTGSFDNTLKLWEAVTGRELRTLTGHTGQVLSLDVSRDGAYLVSGSRDNTLKLWDMVRPEPIGELAGHKDEIQGVAFNADGSLVLTASLDKSEIGRAHV